ncbi:ABC transporter ATP-binding protein [Actinopolymorpha sp. B9G3]|uniref:ABC transporter ATP-binding protein n=1 Tax=Actinopolymorpha sp. B9G3 TaxID=3158970 RepID=UPI0032D99839
MTDAIDTDRDTDRVTDRVTDRDTRLHTAGSGVDMATSAADDLSIVAHDLRRTYRKRKGWFRSGEVVEAVRGISFGVPRGTIFGMVGPNGAGKTTTIKMLSTMLIPTSGSATIGGLDVVRQETAVRRQLGVLFGGDKGLYNQLSGRENLRYAGRLYGMDDRAIAARSEELLARVRLTDRAAERVESYSRGMKQRLHIAKTLLHEPAVVILDEPTIGLDPSAAIDVRQLIADLAGEHTILLTTHDMYEADLLCRELAIVDRGIIVASGTPAALKAQAKVDRRVVVTLTERSGCRAAGEVIDRLRVLAPVTQVQHDTGADGAVAATLTLRCTDTTAALDQALAVLREGGAEVRTIDIREPSLEDAFLSATGREFEEDA